MNSQQILQSDVLDILFEHRNKSYGAYQLRRTYNQRLMLSLALAFSGAFGLLLFLPAGTVDKITPSYNHDEGIVLRVIETPPPVELPPPQRQAATQPAAAQVQYNQIRVAAEVSENNEVPPQEVIAGSLVSGVTRDGAPDVGMVPPATEGNGGGIAAPEVKEEKAFVGVSSAPQFPGGTEAWLRFLGRHLRAPDGMAQGEKKSVLIRFLVSADGSINQYEVLQSGGTAFDNEVIRVLKKMPKWKPALQNGRPVSTTFTQPVTFVHAEE